VANTFLIRQHTEWQPLRADDSYDFARLVDQSARVEIVEPMKMIAA
jgi:hypothetical protein